MIGVAAVVAVMMAVTWPKANAADTLSASGTVLTLGAPNQIVGSGSGVWYGTITNSTACTNGVGYRLPSGCQHLQVQFTSILHTTGTANQQVHWQQSVDGSTWTDWTDFGQAGAGHATVSVVTNLPVYAPFVRCMWITNAEATATITNYSVTVCPNL